MDELITARQKIHNQYYDAFKSFADMGHIKLPIIPEEHESNYHIFFLLTRFPEEQKYLLTALKTRGIHGTFHYIPLHSSPFGRNVLGCEDDLSVTNQVSKTIVRFPIYPSLKSEEIEFIINAVNTYLIN